MNLRDGVIDTRSKLGEGNPWLFSDSDIVRALNTSAKKMCSAAQAVRNTYEFVTVQPTSVGGQTVGQQEYFLPEDCEQPLWIRTQIGILFPTTSAPQENLQIGGYASSIPLSCYFRRGIYLTSQVPVGTGGPAIPGSTEVILPPPNTNNSVRWILGLYPVPANAYPVFADYIGWHYKLVNPLDECWVPDAFIDPWTSYAAWKGFEKQGDLEGAVYHKGIYDAGVQEFKDYQCLLNLQATPPRYGASASNPLFSRGPSILVLAPTSPTIEMP